MITPSYTNSFPVGNPGENPALDKTYGELPPEALKYLSIPGVNQAKVLEWVALGLQEPQTFNQARLLAEAVGYSSEQAKVVAGQWQFESAGGSKIPSAYNYFGIKSHNESVRNRLQERGIDVYAGDPVATSEFEDGTKKKVDSSFMKFNNAFEGFAAHKAFLETNDRYSEALKAPTAKDFAMGLQRAGYATAPNYGETLYNDYVAPKERKPESGDSRPKSLGTTQSAKVAEGAEKAVAKELNVPIPKLKTKAPESFLPQAPDIFIPNNPSVATAQEGSQTFAQTPQEFDPTPFSAPKGFFGSGKTMFANGGPLDEPSAKGFALFPRMYGKTDWATRSNATEFGENEGGQSIGNRNWQEAFKTANTINKRIRQGYTGMEGDTPIDYSQYAKVSPKYFHTKNNPESTSIKFNEGGAMEQLTQFNSGGTHEENPLGGIPQGMNPNGGMNLVEEGETKFEDYIFSDSLTLDKQTVAEFNLPKNAVGKTFSDVSKNLNRPNSRREGDSIEEVAIAKDLEALMTAQEVYKQRETEKKIQELAALNPEMAQKLMAPEPQMAPEEQMGAEGGMMPEDGMMPAQPGMPGLGMKMGGNMYNFGGNIKNPKLMNDIGTGLQVVSPFLNIIPGVGTVASLAAAGVGTGLTMAAKEGFKHQANMEQKTLDAKANPTVDSSGMPLSTTFALGGNMADPPPGITKALDPSQIDAWYDRQLKMVAPGTEVIKPTNMWVNDDWKGDFANIHKHHTEGVALKGLAGSVGHKGLSWGSPSGSTLTPAPAASAAPSLPEGNMYLSANTGQPVYDTDPTTGQAVPRMMPEGSTQDRQYSQYLEEAANSPEAIAKRNAINAESAGNTTRLAGMSSEERLAERQLRNPYTNPVRPTARPQGVSYNNGGGLNNPFARYNPITDLPPNYKLGDLGNGVQRPENSLLPQNYKLGDLAAPKTAEDHYKVNTDLSGTSQDLRSRDTLMGTVGDAAGMAYNLYHGFAKPEYLNPEDLYKRIEAVRPDYTQAENTARQNYQGMRKTIGSSGLTGGQHIANQLKAAQMMDQNLYNLMTAEENAYLQSLDQAQKMNAQQFSDAKKTSVDANWRMDNARREHLKAAINAVQEKDSAKKSDKLAQSYIALSAPDLLGKDKIQVGNMSYAEYMKEKMAGKKSGK
jgi:hypothetical protein